MDMSKLACGGWNGREQIQGEKTRVDSSEDGKDAEATIILVFSAVRQSFDCLPTSYQQGGA